MSVLVVEGLTKRFPRRRGEPPTTAVDGVSFALDRGRTIAVVGESGAGKSTLGRMVLRLIDPDQGRVVFDGTDVTELRSRPLRRLRPRMQMIFQDPFSSLDPRLTIRQSVAEPLRLHTSLNRSDREQRVDRLLTRVGLAPHTGDRLPRQLSGGQLQRVAVARALAVGPGLIVCDEPVAALDVSVRAQVLNLLLDVQEESGVSLIFITHDLSTVRVMAHEMLVMRQGSVVESGTCAEVIAHPKNAYTQRLVGAVPRIKVRQRWDVQDGGAWANGRSSSLSDAKSPLFTSGQ